MGNKDVKISFLFDEKIALNSSFSIRVNLSSIFYLINFVVIIIVLKLFIFFVYIVNFKKIEHLRLYKIIKKYSSWCFYSIFEYFCLKKKKKFREIFDNHKKITKNNIKLSFK